MRSFLSELGCLPVSAMIHVPKAQEVFDSDGAFSKGIDRAAWIGYFNRAFAQLAWWGAAARTQRERRDEEAQPPAFTGHPSQRNAP
jgi:hypothetical protein